ncbi:unnamed protein product [Pseudo-nitzschia multistriata]|uniref:Uncharacterized protein n=1 Tax=Pseudo-nitzschia multistriata TaxID=183589 RepID=A0A448ZID5_9STRA|nr:unnamed protein product [Pseudo-nitzschia multistriata]
MRFTITAFAAFLAATAPPEVRSFTQTTNPTGAYRGPAALHLTPEDLTNYMAKAHEEKIRAVTAVEKTKNAEIQTLKGEVKKLKEAIPKESAVVVSTGPPPSSGMDLSSMTKEQLMAKLVEYQQFMADYIVKAQQQKLKAVQAAELATAQKYEAKIKLLLGAAGSGAAPATTAETTAPSAATKLYDTRSANVAAAAKAGKSRWGDKEVAKVQISSKDAVVEVKAEAKANGASVSVPPPTQLPGNTLFEGRNEQVAAAGKAGKSRWGDAEVKKATEEASKKPALSSAAPEPPAAPAAAPAAPAVSNAVIEEADHGLRNDGGVGGPSLADRVNLGQQLFSGSEAVGASDGLATVASAAPSAYDLRNARVAAAAAAGKSRWGSMENQKAATLAAAAPKITAGTPQKQEIVVTPEVEAADHGLRNDGGVGGPSLAERVNLGRKIV